MFQFLIYTAKYVIILARDMKFFLQKFHFWALTQSFTEEKKGLDFSPRSGEATSGEK